MSVVKNQHYVPRVYLEKFAFKGEQLHVFDKTTSRSFPSSVRNVACEKFFYDVPEKYLHEDAGFQIVEKHLSTMEGRFAPCRDEMLAQVEGGGRFDPRLKEEFADYLLLQMLRTKTHREQYLEMGRMIQAVVRTNPELAKSMELPEDQISLEHARMMFSPDFTSPMKQAILSHIWVIGVNQTAKSLYTSDSPVIRYPHVRHPLMGTNGVACRGIEIDLPLSPRHVLIVAERSYHGHMARWENGAFHVPDENCVLFMNQLLVHEAYRQVYSDQADFTHATDLLRRHPEIGEIDRPRSELASPRLDDSGRTDENHN